jgi:Zn-dependent M28 family amino/carboxypeptidase
MNICDRDRNLDLCDKCFKDLKKVNNGANDDASGVTAVAEMVKYFSTAKNNKRSIIFVFFAAEEKGLLGSKHLTKNKG